MTRRENPDSDVIKNGAKGFWYHDMVDNFKILAPFDLPLGAKFGFSFTSFAVDTPKYMTYLQSSILELGGQIIRAQFRGGTGSLAATLQSATRMLQNNSKDVYAFVNASGLGAISLVGDTTAFPMRSQAVWIKGEAKRIVDRLEIGGTESQGEIAIYYACPRVGSGYTVLGGFMEEGNWYAAFHTSSEYYLTVTDQLGMDFQPQKSRRKLWIRTNLLFLSSLTRRENLTSYLMEWACDHTGKVE